MIGSALIYAAGVFSGLAFACGLVFFAMLCEVGEIGDDPRPYDAP